MNLGSKMWIGDLEKSLSSGATIYIVEGKTSKPDGRFFTDAVFPTMASAQEYASTVGNPKGISVYWTSGNPRHAYFVRIIKTRSKKRIREEIRRIKNLD